MNDKIKELMISGNYEKAIELLNQAIAEDLEDGDSVLSLAISFIENNELKKGKKALDYFHTLSEVTDESLEALGVYWFKNGEQDKAKSTFLKALDINPENGNVHRNVAMIYEIEHDLEKAEHHLSLAVNLQPENYLTQLAIAHVYIDFGNLQGAASILENILSSYTIPTDKTEYIESLLERIYGDFNL